MTYSLSNKFAENYCNLTVLDRVIVDDEAACFIEMLCSICGIWWLGSVMASASDL